MLDHHISHPSGGGGGPSLLRTFKMNFGNNSVQQPTGYAIMNGTNDDAGDAVSWPSVGSVGTALTLTNVGEWSSQVNADTTNATTGDLAPAIIEGFHNAGANSANAIGKQVSGLIEGLRYELYITSVARSTDTTNYDSFFKINTGGSEITVDPVAQKAGPQIITISTNIIADVSELFTLYAREPGAFQAFLNSMILLEYDF